jgi:hypothetical protein
MRAIGVLLPALLLGCSNLTYQKCWKQPPAPESATSDGTKLRIIDARPKWEQKPFRDAIALYGVNDTTPPVWEQMLCSMASVAEGLREHPERIEVTVRALQLLTMDPAKLAQEAEDQHVVRNEPDENAGLSEMLFSAFFGAILEGLLNAPLEKHYPKGLGEVPVGVSCTFKADVTIIWAGGRRQTIPVSALATTDHPNDLRDPRDGLSEAVQMALFQVQEQLRKQLGNPSGP